MIVCDPRGGRNLLWSKLPASASKKGYFSQSITGKYRHFSNGQKFGMLELTLEEQLMSLEDLKAVFNAKLILEDIAPIP